MPKHLRETVGILGVGMASLWIVTVFLFARQIEAGPGPTVRALAAGFFFYSGFRSLNDTLLERWLTPYVTLWNLAGTLIFLVCLLLWAWALHTTQPERAFEPEHS